MKIDFCDDLLIMYLFNKELNLDNKITLIKQLKFLLEKLINNYNIDIKGIYETVIYENKYYGYIIEFEKIKDFEYGSYIDLKLNIKNDQPFYFVTDNYHFLYNCKNIYFKNGFYFVNISEFENVNTIFEYGDIIYKNYSYYLDECVNVKLKNVN